MRKKSGFGYAVGSLSLLLSQVSTAAAVPSFDPAHTLWNDVLKTHVVAGRVDYRTLKNDAQPLNLYLDHLAAVSAVQFNAWNESRRLAFLINAYNASTLRLLLKHYPVHSIKDIGNLFKGPWDQPTVTLFGNTITLNELEQGIIRRQYHDPRVHMALVCAAKGCPPLRREAYTGERLDEQLNEQARRYLASPAGLVLDRVKSEIFISSIFKWYSEDFPSVPAFVEKYSGKKLAGLHIRYLDYDWSLNER